MTPSELTPLRTEAGWSQDELAQRMGVSPSAVSRWEAGERPISRAMAIAILAVLEPGGLDMHELGIILLRHIEATTRFFQEHAHLDYDGNVGIRNLRVEPAANVFQSGGNLLVKGLLVEFDVRFLARGF